MKTQLHVIDTIEGLKDLTEKLGHVQIVAFDTETTGLLKTSEIIGYSVSFEEESGYYIILAKWMPEEQKLHYNQELISLSKEVMQILTTKDLIMHNAVYDCSMVESYFKVRLIDSLLVDTMVLAHLLDENRRIGLKELGKSLFGKEAADEAREMKESVLKNGGKLTKACYEMYKADSYLLAKYGAKDAVLTFKLFLALTPELAEQGLEDFFFKDESMPLLKGPTYDLNTTGLQVDQTSLVALENALVAECAEAKTYIYKEIQLHIENRYPGTTKKNQFNIGSSSQLSWLLFSELAFEFGTLTEEGKAVCRALGLKLPYTYSAKRDFIAVCEQSIGSIYTPEAIVNGKVKRAKKVREPWYYIAADKKSLQKIAPRLKWVERLLEYQKKMKILTTYVKGIESKIQYGVIHPSFLQTGTTSGRYSSRTPNFQNLPRDDERIKKCIISRPGKVFVSADYSQLEPRVFASYSKDKRLMAAFDGTSDFYSVVGIEVYDKFDAIPQKDGAENAFGVKYKKLRDLSKVIALASAYGATPFQLAPTTGKSVQDTQEDMDKYFEAFPGVKTMMLEAHEMAKRDGYVTNLFGRPRRMPDAKNIQKLYGNQVHADLPYEARSLLNLACNHRIQSTGASIINRAAIKFYNTCKSIGINCKIVTQVHDELIIECNETDADDVVLLLQDAMENTTKLPEVELEAIPRITKTLAKH